jgi:glycosyltransferase involved in cell wall biosynthesis
MNNFCIIIPTYNNLLLTKEAIDSVRCQSVQDFNIIITDDSTNDDIRDYVDSISDQRIRYYANKPSLGPVRNWNRGLELADGKYVILLHHDEKMMDHGYFFFLVLSVNI